MSGSDAARFGRLEERVKLLEAMMAATAEIAEVTAKELVKTQRLLAEEMTKRLDELRQQVAEHLHGKDIHDEVIGPRDQRNTTRQAKPLD